jgi:predicted transcriptional regulator
MIADGFVRLCSRDSIMTIKLVKRGLIISQDYSVPVLMRASIEQVMKREFNVVRSDDTLQSVLEKYKPTGTGFTPVVNADETLFGIVEARDLMRIEPPDHHFTMRELARQDYVLAYPGESVDQVHRSMMLKDVENVVVVQSRQTMNVVGVVRANDILQLRRWLLEEETGDLRRTPLGTSPPSLE